MVGSIVYYLTYPFVAPIVALVALLDMPYTGKAKFKENFIAIYGGIYGKDK